MADKPVVPEGLKMGLEVLYEPKLTETVVDIVAIHGLGAEPRGSWIYDLGNGKSFDWLADQNGLRRDCAEARIMLFAYASAYRGRFRLDQNLKTVAEGLLDKLNARRKKHPRRPLVLLGHSLGGIVIAKAVCLAKSETAKYAELFESITSCVTFGTPFRGAMVAEIAAKWAKQNEGTGKSVDSQLLELIKPGNPQLLELTNDFVRICGQLQPKIDLLCFWEQSETNYDKVIEKLANENTPPAILESLKTTEARKFVTEDSACLQGSESAGLYRSHRDLVRFRSNEDPMYEEVRTRLKRLVRLAPSTSRGRFHSARQTAIDDETLTRVLISLNGVDMEMTRQRLTASLDTTSWILKDRKYLDWLNPSTPLPRSYLWLHGLEGKGKTNASLGAINEISKQIDDWGGYRGDQRQLIAYFFCEEAPGCNTAELMLKSILRQLCQQEKILAAHAKRLAAPKSGSHKKDEKAETTSSKPRLSVENLWQCLKEMLTESSVGVIHIIINNLHNLRDTNTLLELIMDDLQNDYDQETERVSVKWFFTSRTREEIERCFKPGDGKLSSIYRINLADSEYDTNVDSELKKLAWKRISDLQKEKNYRSALAYYASSIIGSRAEQSGWIEIAILILRSLPKDTHERVIRKKLESLPQSLKELLDYVCKLILDPSSDDITSVHELMRVLTTTYESPTEKEILMLLGLDSESVEDMRNLQRVVELCCPILVTNVDTGRVIFANSDIKLHLIKHAESLLKFSERDRKFEHGLLGLRCFSHVIQCFSPASQEVGEEAMADGDASEVNKTQDAGKVSEVPDIHVALDDGLPRQSDTMATMEVASEKVGGSSLAQVDEEPRAPVGNSHGTEGTHTPNNETEEYSNSETVESTNDESTDSSDELTNIIPLKALPYATRYWLRHAADADPDVATYLCLEKAFWSPKSQLRSQWLAEFRQITEDSLLFSSQLNGLHVASAIGFPALVATLLNDEGRAAELLEYDELYNQPMHLAAWSGKIDIIEILLRNRAPLDDLGPDGRRMTPLAMATSHGHVETMRQLLKRGADKDAVDSMYGPVINAAILSGVTEAVELLIDYKVKLNFDVRDGEEFQSMPPLALAAAYANGGLIDTILKHGKASLSTAEYERALIAASRRGVADVVEKLFEFSDTQETLQKCLVVASVEENWDVVRLLLRRRTDLDCTVTFMQSAKSSQSLEDMLDVCWKYTNGHIPQEVLDECLYIATDYEKEKSVKVLLTFKANPNARSRQWGKEYGNTLTAAAHDGTINIVNILLEAGADIRAPHGFPLQAAAARGHTEIVEVLLKAGVDVNDFSRRHECRTALQAACDYGHDELAILLLQKGANPNLGGGGLTLPIFAALQLSVTDKSDSLLDELLKFDGIDLDVRSGFYATTPLHYAARFRSAKDVKKLLEAGAGIDKRDNENDTALIYAVFENKPDVVHVLLDHGADITITGWAGLTPLDIAVQLQGNGCAWILAQRSSQILQRLRESADAGHEATLAVLSSEKESRCGGDQRELEARFKGHGKTVFENYGPLREFYEVPDEDLEGLTESFLKLALEQ